MTWGICWRGAAVAFFIGLAINGVLAGFVLGLDADTLASLGFIWRGAWWTVCGYAVMLWGMYGFP